MVGISAAVSASEGWPTYRQNDQRTGITTEQLPAQLHRQWVFIPPEPPASSWSDYERNDVRVQFDDVPYVVAADGAVYFSSSGDQVLFSSGLFPSLGNTIHAVDLRDGSVLRQGSSGGTPQSYMVLHEDLMVIPSLRSPAQVYRRSDFGRRFRRGLKTHGKGTAGVDVFFAEGMIWNFQQNGLVAYGLDNELIVNWPTATRAVVSGGVAYVFNQRGVKSESKWSGRGRPWEETIVEEILAIPVDRMNGIADKDGETMHEACLWRMPVEGIHDLILAGSTLYAGAEDRVLAVDAESGELLWEAPVQGLASGLAVADGRLFVSTTTGRVYCFGAEPVAQPAEVRPPAARPDEDEAMRTARQSVDHLLEHNDWHRGYAVVLGGEAWLQAVELAERTELTVYVWEPDADRAGEVRDLVGATGLHGRRISVLSGPLADMPPYFANIVVCGASALGGQPIVTAGVAVVCAITSHLKSTGGWRDGEFVERELTVFSATDGSHLWTHAGGYAKRPLVLDGTLAAMPFAFDILTGKQALAEDGQPAEVSWGGGCGVHSASATTLFDGRMKWSNLLEGSSGAWSGMRSGCWINIITANGLRLAPEGSEGCECVWRITLKCSMAWYPRVEP
jgi:outer membrane protein assembly factor BamB